MSKVSETLREAALGPTPRVCARNVGAWVGSSLRAFDAVIRWKGMDFFSSLTDEDRRMFLLFVAEAEE